MPSPVGHRFPVPASELAELLGCSERTVRGLVEDLIREDGYAIGSVCGEASGYFLITTPEDLQAGAAHLVARARSLFTRVSALRRNAEGVLPEHREFVQQVFAIEDSADA